MLSGVAYFFLASMSSKDFFVHIESVCQHLAISKPIKVNQLKKKINFDYPLSGRSKILEVYMSYLRLFEVCDTKEFNMFQ